MNWNSMNSLVPTRKKHSILITFIYLRCFDFVIYDDQFQTRAESNNGPQVNNKGPWQHTTNRLKMSKTWHDNTIPTLLTYKYFFKYLDHWPRKENQYTIYFYNSSTTRWIILLAITCASLNYMCYHRRHRHNYNLDSILLLSYICIRHSMWMYYHIFCLLYVTWWAS